MGVGKALDIAIQLRPKFVHIALSLRNKVAQIELAGFGTANPIQIDLQFFLIAANLAAQLDDISGSKFAGFCRVPHPRLNLPGAVGQRQREIERTIFLAAHLLRADGKKSEDHLVFMLCQISDRRFFHRGPIAALNP